MKKLFFLVLLFSAASYECYGMQPQEFDPVKTVLMATYTAVAPIVQNYSNQLLAGGTVLTTAVWAGIVAKNWYVSNAKLYEELQQKAAVDVQTAMSSNDAKIESTASTFYFCTQNEKLQDPQLDKIMAEFNTTFKACLANKTKENKENLWNARVAISNRILELTL